MSAQQTNLGIVVGVDGSPCSHTAVEWAARDAQMRNVALRVVQVVPPVITVNRPGMSGDSSSWKGWGHVRWFIEEVPAGAA